MGLFYGASAQKYYRVAPPHYYASPRVSVAVGGYVPIYPYYGFGYAPFGYGYGYPPYYGYSHPYRPSKLDLKIEDIKKDYQDKIYSVKHDKTLTGKERRNEVRNLKLERDEAVADARKNYYHAPQKQGIND